MITVGVDPLNPFQHCHASDGGHHRYRQPLALDLEVPRAGLPKRLLPLGSGSQPKGNREVVSRSLSGEDSHPSRSSLATAGGRNRSRQPSLTAPSPHNREHTPRPSSDIPARWPREGITRDLAIPRDGSVPKLLPCERLTEAKTAGKAPLRQECRPEQPHLIDQRGSQSSRSCAAVASRTASSIVIGSPPVALEEAIHHRVIEADDGQLSRRQVDDPRRLERVIIEAITRDASAEVSPSLNVNSQWRPSRTNPKTSRDGVWARSGVPDEVNVRGPIRARVEFNCGPAPQDSVFQRGLTEHGGGQLNSVLSTRCSPRWRRSRSARRGGRPRHCVSSVCSTETSSPRNRFALVTTGGQAGNPWS